MCVCVRACVCVGACVCVCVCTFGQWECHVAVMNASCHVDVDIISVSVVYCAQLTTVET